MWYLLEVKQCTLLASQPEKLSSVSDIVAVLEKINTARVYTGNPDQKYTVLVEARNGYFLDPSGKFIAISYSYILYYVHFCYPGTQTVAFTDRQSLPCSTIRRSSCEYLLPRDSAVK